MTVWIGPENAPQTWAIAPHDAEPWHESPVTVHHGLGGQTQTVWTGQAPNNGQRVTLRLAAADVPAFLADMHRPGRVTITTDGPCPIQTGTGIVTNTSTIWRYDLDPPATDVALEMTWT